MKILCLHGSQQTKETFRARIGRLPHKLKKYAELTFVDAPHVLERREGEDVPTRTWWKWGSAEKELELGVEQSMEVIRQAWAEKGPFDGVLGFSMGGTIASGMCVRLDMFPGLRFVIIVCAPDRPNLAPLWKGQKAPENSLEIPSLHVYGKTDQVVAPESCLALSKRFINPIVFAHEKGHCMPTNAAGYKPLVEFVRDMFENQSSNVQQKAETEEHQKLERGKEKQEEQEEEDQQQQQQQQYTCDSEESAQEQKDELEALESIYPDRLEIVQNAPSGPGQPCACFKCNVISPHDETLKFKVVVQVVPGYPNTTPIVKLEHSLDMLQLPIQVEQHILKSIREELSGQVGMPCAFVAISAAETWLEDESNLINSRNQQQKGTSENLDGNRSKSNQQNQNQNDNNDDDDDGIDDSEEATRVEKIWEDEIPEEEETKLVEEATREACNCVAAHLAGKGDSATKFSTARGVKKFIVGFVGKPSVGKSSAFCAISRLQSEAKVAAHPFTTIEPNYGTGWGVSTDPFDKNEFATQHGRDAQGRRLLPILIRDVAGLVPGAYKGHGKGNRFLNDLCEADVFVHVVDVSNSADKNGVEVSVDDENASSAAQDVKWVREELHRWIFGNVAAKWRSVVRQAKVSEKAAEERVLALFSGYKGTRNTIQTAAVRAKLDLAQANHFSRFDLHRLVANFLSVRFPMCLALNKCDKIIHEPDFQERIQDAKKMALDQGYLSIPCSAMVETTLLTLANQGIIDYQLGATTFSVLDSEKLSEAFGNDKTKLDDWMNVTKKLFSELGGTGLLNCISSAIQLRHPVLCYPVHDLTTGAPLAKASGKGQPTLAPYRDCLQILPGTTVEDVFLALKRGVVEEFRLEGDFIRAEGTSLEPGNPMKQCGKDTVVDSSVAVLKILTNKKPVWQQKLRAAQKHATQQQE